MTICFSHFCFLVAGLIQHWEERMGDLIRGADPSVTEKSGFDASRISEVKAWLSTQFDSVGKDVPEFEYTPRSIAHLHSLATISQAKTQAAAIVASDFRQKAVEYRSQGYLIIVYLLHLHMHTKTYSPFTW